MNLKIEQTIANLLIKQSNRILNIIEGKTNIIDAISVNGGSGDKLGKLYARLKEVREQLKESL